MMSYTLFTKCRLAKSHHECNDSVYSAIISRCTHSTYHDVAHHLTVYRSKDYLKKDSESCH